MRIEQQQLKAFLLDSGLISEADVLAAEKEAEKKEKRFEDILLFSGKLAEEDLVRLKAYILGIPFVDLTDEKIDEAVLGIIPEPVAKSHNIVAFRKKANELEVAMLDPDDIETIDFIKKKSNLRILPRLTNAASIKRVLSQYQKSLEAEFGEIIKGEDEAFVAVAEKDKEVGTSPEDLKKIAEDLPVIRIVDTLVRHAILQRASDIHIEPTEKEVVVRYRIDGILHDAMVLPKQIATGIVARIKVLANLKLDEHRLPQDGRFKIETNEYKISFRVSVLPIFDGEKIVIRLLPEDTKAFTLEELGFHGDALVFLHSNFRKPVGMILVTGPTGSGKTTTLYSVLSILNTPDVNISTVEDPVEYRMPRVNQTQVRSDIGFTFATGLRSLVRQDPDIIMVGEIRDEETASLAINAALTGHQVLSTLHTNSAAGALPRLLDMKVEPFLIASTVNVVVGQRLVRKLCREKEEYRLSQSELVEFQKSVDMERVLSVLQKEKLVSPKTTIKDLPFWKPKAGGECPDGFSGRVGIYEVLPISSAIKELVIRRASSDEVERQAKTEGMLSMLEDGIIKCIRGITTIEEVLRVVTE